jgi:hypothetical protein
MKTFTLGQVLTVTSGKMLCEGGMKDLYEILNYLTGDEIYTHQIPSALDQCRPYVLSSYPFIETIDVSGINRANFIESISDMKMRHGNKFALDEIPHGEQRQRLIYDDLPDEALNKVIIVKK